MSDLEPSEVESRRSARARALELLYESEVKALAVPEVLAGLPVAPAPMAVELVRGVAAEAGRVDEIVARRVAPRWSLARLAALDRAVLRLGTYELLDRPDTPAAVVLNEAVLLARRYGSDDSSRFVNGVLAAVATEVRGDRPAGALPTAAAGDGTEDRVAALVIDLDGVIRHWDPDALAGIERTLGLPEGVVGAAAFASERLDAAMRGALTFDEWCAGLGDAVAAAHQVDAGAVAKGFAGTGWQIDEAVLDIVDRVRARAPVALLSNASDRLLDDLRVSGIAERFDAVVGSAEIGLCKPDAGAFTQAAERLGVAAEGCLVVDDRAENVAGARAAGMRAELFTDPDALAATLAAAGLLEDAT